MDATVSGRLRGREEGGMAEVLCHNIGIDDVTLPDGI
jgi:hypothetical protein